jgi:hypothetical protein
MRKVKQAACIIILLLAAIKSQAQHGHNGMSADKPSVHGMLIFGTQKIYASHLPLFHAPHNYQIILELQLDSKAKKLFITDQQQHPEFTTYTIEPETFILPDMIAAKGTFTTSLYRGHFERGGVKIAANISTRIASVLYFKKFDAAGAKNTQAVFLLFGNDKEQFAIHQISNMPDFEQLVQVKAAAITDTCATVVFPGTNNPAGVSGNTVQALVNGKATPITLLKQLYLEFDDLKE